MVALGITSFAELSPEIIKAFNLFDNGYKTLEAKMPITVASGKKIVDILSLEEIETVGVYCVNAVAPPALRNAVILMVALNIGFRSSDIIGIKISDID